MKAYKDLTKNLKKDFSELKKIRIALLGDSATQLLVKALKGYGYEVNCLFEIFEADYNQIDLQVFDPNSGFYQFNPEYVIIFQSIEKLTKTFYKLDDNERKEFAANKTAKISVIYQTITSGLKCRIICFNFNESDDGIFGNYAAKVSQSFIYQVRKLNLELMNLSQIHQNLYLIDINSLYHTLGSAFCRDEKMYINSDLLFSIDFLPVVAKNLTDVILAISGNFKKCLILDLDNTLWGGIIGDDGLENIQIGDLGIGKAFSELQRWIKQLKQRGIILAICSKNDEKIAKEPFEKHPEMVLRSDDIAVFIANWENKAENIIQIQNILNIGFDSMVFLDDNPFERNMVRSNIPAIAVPELPEDPAEYLVYLKGLNLFETASYTAEDERRTQQYREEGQRSVIKKQYINEDDFLSSLQMQSEVRRFDNYIIPRVAQLTQRSNQFNLRTIRYTEADIREIANSTNYLGISFTLEDKFGDYGLVSAIILKKQEENLFIDTWIMSCRVLKRGMETFVLDQIVQIAIESGFKNIIGEFIPTLKNEMVKDHYQNLGFNQIDNQTALYILDCLQYKTLKTLIKIK